MSAPTREEALAHFGVKGMKWGVSKGPGGTADRIVFGKKGAQRIANRVARGQSPTVARLRGVGRAAVRAVLITWAALLARNLVREGATRAVLAKNTANLAKAGRDAIPAIMATAAKLKYAPLKGGAFVITTLK